MEDQDKNINEILLIRYINQELTGAEHLKVEAWINKSEENRKIAEDYYYLSWAVNTLRVMKQCSPQKALKKINKRIYKNKVRYIFQRIQQIAAILLIAVVLCLSYLLIHSKNRVTPFYLETRMTPGMIGSMLLPDGTKVWLNSSSSLKYPSFFDGNTREVFLDGEAYFDVQPDKQKKFIVHTENTSISVYGTEFNVDAYSNNNFVTTTLISGSIEFTYTDKNEHINSFFIQPNQQVVYDKATTETIKKEADYNIAWREGKVILNETSLSDVIWILSKRFNIDFEVKDSSLYNHSFTGIFTNQQIERILEHFKISSDINYKIEYQQKNDSIRDKSRIILY